ncbi:hypothetical protein A1O1_00345 [Capronia coronata CBS 617.96]|uniref:Uncharacterized protein n=1 Tax=Capronia coronata CBS 617.96 TaxID=1182541 RepID=W9YZU6_9EURO|nr:uncharacterized protein A1O1_00345 [Capronia coronata CBS 617.96]EXJ95225.1 hypothetical protein A1O1_00345 [Capronia coronata CBS 617.96]
MAMKAIDEALAADVPLPASLLWSLGKGSLQKYLHGDTETSEPLQISALWRKLILTATSPQVVHNHITAACNALSVFLNGAALSRAREVRDFVHSEEAWFDAYQCCHRVFNDGKTKPAIQVLETLCRLLQDFDEATLTDILVRAAFPLIRTVLLSSPRAELKKACLMLSCLIRRTPILDHLEPLVKQCTELHQPAWTRLLAKHNITPHQVLNIGGGGMTNLFLALVFAMTDLDTRTSALKLCSTLCSIDPNQREGMSLQILAQKHVELYLESNRAALGEFAENVLPAILNTNDKLMVFVEPYLGSCPTSETHMAVFLAALKAGRLQSILTEEGVLQILRSVHMLGITRLVESGDDGYSFFRRTMSTSNPEIRILAYNLLTSTPTTTAIVPSGVLSCVLSTAKYLHDDAEAHERSEILSITRRLLKRIEASWLSLRKAASSKSGSEEIDTVEAQYKSFQYRFYNFLKRELRPGVSYPRHSLSLHSLQYFFDMTTATVVYKDDTEMIKILCCLVLDPFEEVRSTVSNLLQFLVLHVPDLVSRVVDTHLLNRIGLMAAHTVRGDHADGMGRLWALSRFSHDSPPSVSHIGHDKTDTYLSPLLSAMGRLMSDTGDLRPTSKHPIHAYLLSIHYRLRDMKVQRYELTDIEFVRIFDICTKVWHRVSSRLCIDSPDTSLGAEDEDTNEGPMDLLAYSWRALRDSSLVLQSLLVAAQPNKALYLSVGDLCLDQLISLRHRGAFSAVAQTFNLCCEKARASPDSATRGLIKLWYSVALNQIDEQSDRLTRRSAGLPATMVALLSPADPDFFDTTVSDLMSISRRSIYELPAEGAGNKKLPQVHALNCLKEIMTNSRLSAIVVQYLERILELAADCLSSKIWAIRNCGLMLLRACINRLDSTSTNETTSLNGKGSKSERVNSDPSTIAVSLLESAAEPDRSPLNGQHIATEHAFAALDLLSHIHSDEGRAEETNSIIARQISHSTWAIRDHAASLLATRLSGMVPALAIERLISETGLTRNENQAHGVLLCCRYITRTAQGTTTKAEVNAVLNLLSTRVPWKDLRGRSPYVLASYLDVLNDVAALCLENTWNFDVIEKASSSMSLPSSSEYTSAHWPYLLRRILLLRMYRHILRDTSFTTTNEQERSLIAELISSPDSLSYLLDVIKHHHYKKPRLSMVTFLVNLIHGGYDKLCCQPDILQQAFSCLTRSLENLGDIPRELHQLNWRISLKQLSSTRGLGNAAMELESLLLCIELPSQQSLQSIQQRTRQWLHRVELAAADSLDFPTRLSAARALSIYYGRSEGSESLGSARGASLRLMLVLYDLLNDDDEEVRFEAIQATRSMKLHQASAVGDLGMCALAARELLLDEINQRYQGTQALGRAAVMKLMNVGQTGQTPANPGTTTDPFQTSVASSLLAIFKGKHDLFAEERQNLYVDDLREVQLWSQTLYHSGLQCLPPEQIEAAVQWTTEGLDQLVQSLQMEHSCKVPISTTNQYDAEEVHKAPRFLHPVGATYEHATLVLFLRVLSLARVLLADGTVVCKGLLETLESVRAGCLQGQVNEVLLEALDLALAEQ